MADEKIFLETKINKANVLVSNTRFVVPDVDPQNSKTYAISHISAVSCKKGEKMSSKLWGFTILIVILALSMMLNKFVWPGVAFLVIAALIVAFHWKNIWYVIINIDGTETEVLSSRDSKAIESIAAALNNALVYRG